MSMSHHQITFTPTETPALNYPPSLTHTHTHTHTHTLPSLAHTHTHTHTHTSSFRTHTHTLGQWFSNWGPRTPCLVVRKKVWLPKVFFFLYLKKEIKMFYCNKQHGVTINTTLHEN